MNIGDPREAITRYVEEGKFTFKIVMGEHGKGGPSEAYGVQAYPTNYVLDGAGKVAWRGVGFDEAGLRAALAKLGLK